VVALVRPVLLVRRLVRDGRSVDGRGLATLIALADEPGRNDVLARLAGQGEVFALTRQDLAILYLVFAPALSRPVFSPTLGVTATGYPIGHPDGAGADRGASFLCGGPSLS